MQEQVAEGTDSVVGWDALADKILSLQVPTQDEFVSTLVDSNALTGVVLLAFGFVYMLNGWKIFKFLVIVNAAGLGIFFGSRLGGYLQGDSMPLFGGLAGGTLFAVVAWPLMKHAVCLMGALAGAVIGFGLWNYIAHVIDKPDLASYAWAGGVIGLIGLGMMAFVIFRLVIMIFTALQGGIMGMSGLLVLVLKYEPFQEDLLPNLKDPRLLPLMMVLPAVVGFAFQHSALSAKMKKKKKAEGDG